MRGRTLPAIVSPLALAALVACAGAPVAAAEPTAYWLVPEDADGAVEIRLLEGAGAPRAAAARDVPVEVAHLTRSGRSTRTVAPPAVARCVSPGVHLVVLAAPPDSTGAVRFAKTLAVVPPTEDPGALHRSETGQVLELVPEDDPLLLLRRGGAPFAVQVLFDREPLAGAQVVASAGGGATRRARTDALGVVELDLDRPGTWSLRVAHRGACGDCAHPGVRLWISTLTLRTGMR